MSYYVTIHNLQIRCDLQDYFRVSSQSASSTDFRLCGNYENMPFSTISFCVMKPLSTEVDLYLNLELVSGPGEKGGYSGLYVEFFATNDEGKTKYLLNRSNASSSSTDRPMKTLFSALI